MQRSPLSPGTDSAARAFLSVPSSVASVDEENPEQWALDAQLLFQGADRALGVLDVALDRFDLGQVLANRGIRLPDLRLALPFKPFEFPFEVRHGLFGILQALLVLGRLLRLLGLGLGFLLGLLLRSLLGPPFRAALLERLFRLLGHAEPAFAQRRAAAFIRHCGGGKLNAANGDGKSESDLCHSPGDHEMSPSSSRCGSCGLLRSCHWGLRADHLTPASCRCVT